MRDATVYRIRRNNATLLIVSVAGPRSMSRQSENKEEEEAGGHRRDQRQRRGKRGKKPVRYT